MSEIKIWLSTSDIKNEVPKWSTAVTDDVLRSSLKTEQTNLKLRIPAALYTYLNTVVTANYAQWSRVKSYAVTNRVIWDGKLYESKGTQSGNQPPNSTHWTELAIWDVWNDYIKPYLCWATAARYAPFADKWMAQEGARRVMNDVADPLTADEIAMMTNAMSSQADRYYLAFKKYMSDNNHVIDTVSYKPAAGENLSDKKIKSRIRIV